ncbi:MULTISPECIES: amidohydrolase family protein [Lascolabacillus]|jgi:hypothetical protein|uniref:amidohydrolase family protein n=1 Tax=Lascolabacillus TaxID=1924067 RepID=UPI0006B351DF|nr:MULTISPECIES: amidohydrolase family protein [Lascolabacillus]MCK9500958.1 amidohydrolase [Lascolabacillus sp.]MDD3658835.1 amidohydrolase family protein [Lascolabacillus sp.]MDI9626584.1 amidohydrolase family protein [Bacteroidota bacterium]TAH61829.1 MAG: hypothetical protein EWM46_03990 [Fermentimonas caenicola]
MRNLILLVCLSIFPLFGYSQYVTKYPDIPRIDVHSHIGNDYQSIESFLKFREKLLSESEIDLAMMINLDDEQAIDSIFNASNGRIVTAINDFEPQRGLTHSPEDIYVSLKKGYVGYKIWHGPAERRLKEGEEGIRYIDDIAHEPVFAAMEKAGLPGASFHIADPNGPFGNRGKWAADPVEFWRQVVGLEHVLQRHPDLVVIAAHCAWLICQDAQIDYLRYMLSTYPNFYVDLAATFQYFHMVDHSNLRDFLIEYSDRILYGTDVSTIRDAQLSNNIARYNRTFRILETDEMVEGGFFGMNPVKGLNLPREVLEKIYYKNALKLYPGLKEKMTLLGFT